MKAILLEQLGPPEALNLVELPKPVAGPGQVLVAARYIGVGMPDVQVRTGKYNWMPRLPAIPGIEMSGIVEAVGAGVTTVAPGDSVIVSARERAERSGCYAEFAAVEERAVYRLAPGTDLKAAATMANYQVAWHVLHTSGRVRAGDTVLVLAAAGGVGSALLDLIRLAEAKAIAVVGSAARGEATLKMGAVAAIDRKREDLGERVRAITGGHGADLVLDPVGGPHVCEGLKWLAPFGMLVIYGGLGGPPSGDLLGAIKDTIELSPAVRRFTMHTLDHDPERRRASTLTLLEHLAAGRLRPHIDAVLPLRQAGEAQRRLEAGEVAGKILLDPRAD